MTIYQAEMQRRARGHACEARMNATEQDLLILHNGNIIAHVTKDGQLHYPYPRNENEEKIIEALRYDINIIREYVGIYESTPPMKAVDVSAYRKFTEFGSIVLAGMYSPTNGFMFCTWEQSNGGTYLAHGHYTPNYNAAKEDFAVRAGIIDGNRLFDLDESGAIHGCILYTLDHCETLDYKDHQVLSELLKKTEDIYPPLKDAPHFIEEPFDIQSYT